MKKRALKKDFRMEVRKSLNRFLSIFFIVALGVAFFSGIQATAPDMRATGDYYFDSNQLMDLRVISTLGLTENDLEAIREIDGVENVNGCYMEDVYCGEGDSREVLHVETFPDDMNQVAVIEGELPQKAGECFLDIAYVQDMGYSVGDEIEVTPSDADNTSLKRTTFTISGYGYSPCYISFHRGSTTLGTGSISAFLYVLPEDFDAEVYTVAYLKAAGAEDETAFTDGYDDIIKALDEKVEGIADARCEIRYDEVLSEAEEKIADAKQEVEDGKKELADAKKEVEDGKAEADEELAEAESELVDGQQQLIDGKRDLNDAKKEVASGEQEISDGEREIEENAQKLEDGKAQFSEGQSTLAEGEKEYQSGLQQYNQEAASAEKELQAAQKQINEGKTALEAGWQEYNARLAQIESGEQQLAAGEQQLSQSQTQYDQGKAAFDQGKAQYESGVQQYNEGLSSYNAAAAQLEAGQKAYEEGKASLDAGQSEYDAAIGALQKAVSDAQAALDQCNGEIQANNDAQTSKSEELTNAQNLLTEYQEELARLQKEDPKNSDAIDQAQKDIEKQTSVVSGLETELNNLKAQGDALAKNKVEIEQNKAAAEKALTDGQAALAGKKEELDAARTALGQTASELEASRKQLQGVKQALDQNGAKLEATKQTLEEKEKELLAAKEQLEAGWSELNSKKSELAAGRSALENAKQTLEEKTNELEAGQKQIDDGYQELKKAKAKLTSAREELDIGWAKLNASQSQISDGERQLEEGRQQLSDARDELADAKQKIADGKKELAENNKKIKDGWEEYEKGKKQAEDKIAEGEQQIADAEQDLLDAEQEIADAEQELSDLKYPEWYVEDRNVLPEFTGFGENAERIGNLAKVVPLLFFLVAALISLTTMTRMVEEERTQIGTLKALGYGKGSIASKYLKYAFWATMGGSAFGILIGQKLLPWVIINAYGIIYLYLPKMLIPYDWSSTLVAAGAALFCTIGATFMSCWKELLSVPAQLMRPPAPKEGKRVILEYVPFLWKRLSFSWKSTVRNLFRYKKRFLMTIIGIGGCMGLLIVGYGLQDSIMDIGILQYEELHLYDAMVILDTDASEAKQDVPKQLIAENEKVTDYKTFYMQQKDIRTDGTSDKEWSVYVYVPEDLEGIEDFFTFRDRETKEEYQLTDEGAIISEKVADKLDIHPGDVIKLKRDGEADVEIPIAAVCENYLSHYLYMTPTLYEKVYGETPQYNCVFLKSDEEEEVIEEIGEELLAQDAVLNVTYTGTMAEQIDSMIGAMDIVMIVLIVSAGMLAFVVLYNLNNININERRRELATLKVLGFYDGEVGAYVYRENILLTIFGMILGVFIGKLLHAYVITTVEIDSCMFGRNINLDSFLYAILFTIAFSVIVNFAMYFKLKKIDMVESLKSIE